MISEQLHFFSRTLSTSTTKKTIFNSTENNENQYHLFYENVQGHYSLPQFSHVSVVKVRSVTLGPTVKRPGGPGGPALPCAPGSP